MYVVLIVLALLGADGKPTKDGMAAIGTKNSFATMEECKTHIPDTVEFVTKLMEKTKPGEKYEHLDQCYTTEDAQAIVETILSKEKGDPKPGEKL